MHQLTYLMNYHPTNYHPVHYWANGEDLSGYSYLFKKTYLIRELKIKQFINRAVKVDDSVNTRL